MDWVVSHYCSGEWGECKTTWSGKKTEKWTSSEIHPTSTSMGRKSHTWVWNAGEKHRHHTLSQKRGKRGLAEVIGRCCFRIQMFFVNINFGIVTNLVWLLLLPDSGDMQVVIRFLARRLIAGRQRQRVSMTPCTHRCKLITESWSWWLGVRVEVVWGQGPLEEKTQAGL